MISRCGWEWEGGWWVVWKVTVADGLAVLWFARREPDCDGVWQNNTAQRWFLKGQQAWMGWVWFAAHPHSSAAWMDLSEETLCFPHSLYHSPARSLILCGYLLWSTFFSLRLSPPFRRVQVCVHSTEQTYWLVYKGSNTKWIRKFWFPFATPPHTPPHTYPPTAVGRGGYRHIVVHLPTLQLQLDRRQDNMMHCFLFVRPVVQQVNLIQAAANRRLLDWGPSSWLLFRQKSPHIHTQRKLRDTHGPHTLRARGRRPGRGSVKV